MDGVGNLEGDNIHDTMTPFPLARCQTVFIVELGVWLRLRLDVAEALIIRKPLCEDIRVVLLCVYLEQLSSPLDVCVNGALCSAWPGWVP